MEARYRIECTEMPAEADIQIFDPVALVIVGSVDQYLNSSHINHAAQNIN